MNFIRFEAPFVPNLRLRKGCWPSTEPFGASVPVTQSIASFGWSLTELQDLHLHLAECMKGSRNSLTARNHWQRDGRSGARADHSFALG